MRNIFQVNSTGFCTVIRKKETNVKMEFHSPCKPQFEEPVVKNIVRS